MTTQQYLADKGVSMEQAQTFIMDNLDNLENIYDVAKEFSVNNDMIADIVQANFPGLNGTVVSGFFDNNGYDGNALGFNSNVADVVIDGLYSGSYSGSQNGTFDFTIADTSVSGTWYSPAWAETGYVYGSVDNQTGSLDLRSNDEDGVAISFTGVITDTSVNGTWSMPLYGDGSFSAHLA
jgi:hypothetical protein